MSINEWLEDSEEELATIDAEIEGANKRASEGYGGIRNTFKRSSIGPIEAKTVVRLLSGKHGEVFKHWFYLPNGKKIGINCAASKQQQDNRVQLCPGCAFTATGGGDGKERARVNHEYFFVCLVGQVKKVYREGPGGEEVAVDKVIWMPEPQCLAATPPIAKGFFKWHKNLEFPKGAGGRITAYNFAVYAVPGKTDKDVRYKVEYYDSEPRVTTALNDKNERVDIDLNIAALIRTQIEAECRPTKASVIQSMIEEARGQGVIASTSSEGNSGTEAPATTRQPQATVSSVHDMEDGEGQAPAASSDEGF